MSRVRTSLFGGSSLVLLALWGLGACLTPFPPKGTTPTTPRASKGAATRPAAAQEGARRGAKEPPQTYAEAWDLICHAERRSGASEEASRPARAVKVSEWIVAHVKNKKARYWWIGYAKVKKEEREAYFRATAKAAGQARCPLASLLFPPRPAGKRAPASAPATP